MNKFKKLATLCMALVFSLGLTAFAACGTDTSSNKESSSAVSSSSVSSEKESASSESASESSSANSSVDSSSSEDVQPVDGAYVFVVKHADGSPAVGVGVQLCTATQCIEHFPKTNAAGVSVFKVSEQQLEGAPATAQAYTIHIVELDEYGYPAYNDDYTEMLEYEIDGVNTTPTEYGVVYITLK
ncbi:MAG: hypothetical protein IJ393_00290 [Clostridia bacterium]|nr:hypothetical protein [Clostridia bacterium]